MVVSALVVLCTGCATHSPSSGGTTTPSSGGTSLTGNWEFQVSTNGVAPFTKLSGFVNQPTASPDSSNAVTASLLTQSNTCFSGTKVLDFSGYLKGSTAQLVAFPSFDQSATLGLSTQCTGGLSLCGGYTVAGGCADKASGTLLGVRYSDLSGTFSTAVGVMPGLSVQITQPSQGTGQGTFLLSGTATATGATCFTSGTLNPQESTLSGSAVHLSINPAAGATQPLILDGTINADTTTLTINAVTFSGGTCMSSLQQTALSRVSK